MRLLALLIPTLLATAACRPASQPELQEPIGIRIEAPGRTLNVTAVARRGEDVKPCLEGLAGLIARASGTCLPRGSAAFELEIAGGAVRFSGRPGADPERCLAGALDGKTVGEPNAAAVHLRLRVSAE